MFTGIIEGLGEVVNITREGENTHITLTCPFTHELKVDQSLAHNGVCLTVVAIDGDTYTVTAIKETLEKSNTGKLTVGDPVNLERAMVANGRFDGHVVQGHVDQVGECISLQEENGSWTYTFRYNPKGNITVEKGSITVNGVSLTVVNSLDGQFSVCIIPYTKAHTNFNTLKVGDAVNLEFDIVGKYVQRLMAAMQNQA
ncbi:MAG: riboflavin synthase [Flavobacteriales bacterium]|nr:riboflavin synthase [Flavobacteriales bacterium]